MKLLNDNRMTDTIANEGLKYISDYVGYRFKKKYPNLNLRTCTKYVQITKMPDWITFLSDISD